MMKILMVLTLLSFSFICWSEAYEPSTGPDTNGKVLNQVERVEGEGDEQDRQRMEEDPKLKHRYDEPVRDDAYPEEEYDDEVEW